ncbi:putative reverse transcriptase domain-containing protein [Tanacetum coccineum]|uniref:Reverse transcriptase domain-containing protein n=1 Tax=Tanacetum coccineum TaxID=301880 RepID=A0ABQ4WH16_9ASTR
MEAPPSPDYVPGPEYPPSPVYVPYVPEPVYPKLMPLEDDVLLAEEQPLLATVSPTADSPGYITESDPEEDPEEDDEDPEEDPADYPDDRDDNDNEEDEMSSKDDADDEEEDEDEDEEEKEDHLAPVDSVPPPTCCTTARMSIRDQIPTPFPHAAEVDRFLAISTPPSSPLTSYSSPLPQIPFPPILVSSPLPVSPPPLPASPTYSLGYRAGMIWLRAELPSTSHLLPLSSPIVLLHTRAFVAMMRAAAPSTYILASRSETPPSGTPPLLPIPLPTPSPPLLLPFTDCRAGVFEVTLPPQKRLCIALGLRFEVIESSSAPIARPTGGFRADYGFVNTLDDEIRRDPERERMTDFVMTIRKDTDEIYGRLMRHMSMDASDTACFEVRALRTTVLAQQTKIEELRAADRRRQTQLTKAPTLMRTLQTHKMSPKRTTRSTPATTTTPTTSMNNEQLKRLIDQGVADALTARDADRSRNGEDSHDSGTGVRRQALLARECTYPDFMKCKPLYFKGTEGVVELTQWFERMEIVLCISNSSMENQIKFSTCTLLGSALTWWNSHIKTIGHDVAYAMTLTNLTKKMIEKYCPRGEVKKVEGEMRNLKVKGTDVLMDKKIHTFAERQSENKRKQDDNQHQQQNKRQNTGRAYAERSGEKKPYGGSKPLCSKCNYHHDGQYAPKCHKCNRVGHLACDCRSTTNANTANNQRGNEAGQKPTCFECGAQGHFKRECPKLKNNNHGNQGINGNAPAKVYAVGRAGANPDSNVVTGMFLLNNCYASVLFDTGADRSFMSTAFSSQIDIIPSTFDLYYDVELADGRIIGLNTVIRGFDIVHLKWGMYYVFMTGELKVQRPQKVDETTKRALLHTWIEIGNKEGLLNDEVSSDKEWKEHEYKNPPNDSFPKPYVNINNEKDKNHHNENNGDDDKLSGMNLSGAPHSKKINNEQPNEGVCRVDKFEVIKYTIGDNEEFLAICIRECDFWAHTVNGVSSIYHDIFPKKDEGWTVHHTK